jgi:molybdate transport system substrate-binding protein
MKIRTSLPSLAAWISLAVCLLPQTVAAQSADIHVLSSNGIRSAMEKLIPEYERKSGYQMNIQFGASATLKTSIEHGEPFDVAILTLQVIDDLIKQGRIASETLNPLATTDIGIAVRAGTSRPAVKTAGAVKQLLLKSRTVGYVQEGASTPAIVNMLNRLGIAEQIRRKTIFQAGAGESMASVADGQTDVAFALVSEIVSAAGVQLAGPLPSEFQRPIIMTSGISTSTNKRAAADKLIQLLMSPEAETVIKSTGLRTLTVKREFKIVTPGTNRERQSHP